MKILEREITYYLACMVSVISLHPVFPFSIHPMCSQRHFSLCMSKFTRFFLQRLSISCRARLLFSSSFFWLMPFLSPCVLYYGCFLPLLTSLYNLLRARHSLLSENIQYIPFPSSFIVFPCFFFSSSVIQKFIRLSLFGK